MPEEIPARVQSGIKLVVSVDNELPDGMVCVLFENEIFETETAIVNQKDLEWFKEKASGYGLAVSDTGTTYQGAPVYEVTESRIHL